MLLPSVLKAIPPGNKSCVNLHAKEIIPPEILTSNNDSTAESFPPTEQRKRTKKKNKKYTQKPINASLLDAICKSNKKKSGNPRSNE